MEGFVYLGMLTLPFLLVLAWVWVIAIVVFLFWDRSQAHWNAVCHAVSAEGLPCPPQTRIRATGGQTERWQASLNITPETKANRGILQVGAACRGCAAAQLNARVTNVTGTVEGGGRINNPEYPGAWKRWRDG